MHFSAEGNVTVSWGEHPQALSVYSCMLLPLPQPSWHSKKSSQSTAENIIKRLWHYFSFLLPFVWETYHLSVASHHWPVFGPKDKTGTTVASKKNTLSNGSLALSWPWPSQESSDECVSGHQIEDTVIYPAQVQKGKGSIRPLKKLSNKVSQPVCSVLSPSSPKASFRHFSQLQLSYKMGELVGCFLLISGTSLVKDLPPIFTTFLMWCDRVGESQIQRGIWRSMWLPFIPLPDENSQSLQGEVSLLSYKSDADTTSKTRGPRYK